MDARAAIDRAVRSFSNEPEYDDLAAIRENFDYRMNKTYRDRGWGLLWTR